jgi:hypothetical protein
VKDLRGSPYTDRLIAEKQRFVGSVSENGSGELGHQEEVFQRESGDGDAATEFGQIVLVGLADFFDDAVKTKPFQQT